MKKILLIAGVLISSVAFPQRYLPKGGSVGQVVKIASDGVNCVWSNLSGVATVVAPLVLTANTLSITANTFVQNSGNTVDVNLNGQSLSNVSSFTVTTNALFQNDAHFNDSYFGDALRYGNNGDQGRTTWDSEGLFIKGGGTGLNLQLGSNNRKMVRLIDSINTVVFLSPICVNTYSVDASAILKLESTTQGFLPPRMTAAQAEIISAPADGLIVYVTDTNGTFTAKGFWGRVDGVWAKLNN